MTFEQAKALRAAIEAKGRPFEAVLSASPKGPMGLTPDAVKATPEWRAAYLGTRAVFAELRRFNAWFTKAFRAELQAERRAKYAPKVSA